MVKDKVITGTKAAVSLIPWAGGIINEVISYYQGKYVEKRINKLEKILGEDKKEVFKKKINDLTECEYFLSRKIIKFYLLEAEPIVSEAIVKFLVEYIISNKKDSMNYLISILCQLDSSDIELLKLIKTKCNVLNAELLWDSISPYVINFNDKEDKKIPLNNLISTDFSNESNNNISYNIIGFSFIKLNKLNVINTYFPIYPGKNNVRNVESFIITPLGKELLKYID